MLDLLHLQLPIFTDNYCSIFYLCYTRIDESDNSHNYPHNYQQKG